MHYFLAKTDPETYSIADLARERETVWDGVHSAAAILVIKSWNVGDHIIIYHSQGEKCIVGLMEVAGTPYENTADPRRSWAAKVKYIKEFPEAQKISLALVKQSGKFADFALVKQGRLSTMACPAEFITWLKSKGVELP